MEKDLKKGVKRIMVGSGVNGIFIDISAKGIAINGYQEGSTKDVLYANVRTPIEITWTDLEKMKVAATTKPKRRKSKMKKEGSAPYYVEEKLDKEYIDGLPVVTMNNKKYLLDPDRRERRPCDDPAKVYKY